MPCIRPCSVDSPQPNLGSSIAFILPRGPKKQEQLNGKSQLTALVFLDHPVSNDLSAKFIYNKRIASYIV